VPVDINGVEQVHEVGAGSAIPVTIVGSVSTKTPLTASSPTFATVGVASSLVVPSNAARKGLALINTSTNNISFGIGVAAVMGSGITLTPNGVWEMDEFTFSTAAINAIASLAGSNLAIQEFTT
jgi:hypothetical protein